MNSQHIGEPVKKGYFASRWNGHVPRGTLFWWDMVIVGTLVNMVAGLVSLILLAKGVHGGIWLVFHLVLVPYNLFLLVTVWRTSADSAGLRALAMCWFAITLLI